MLKEIGKINLNIRFRDFFERLILDKVKLKKKNLSMEISCTIIFYL